MNELLDGMESQGWARMAGCLSDVDSRDLRHECEEASARGEFRRAGVGGAAHLEVRDEIRQDQVLWLDTNAPSPCQGNWLQTLETLRLALNQRFFLGLFTFDGHFAIYPVGAFYKPHLDRPAGTSARILTVILFLNENWQPGDGGELKLWTTAGDAQGPFILIEPRMGTVVCFLSADFWHEVLPALKIRRSITGWFC